MTNIIFRIICILYGVYSIYVISKPSRMPYYLGVTLVLDAINQAYGTYSTVLSSGGITLYMSDMPILVMVAILILSKTKLRKNWFTGMWLFMFMMIIYSAVWGFLNFGLNIYYLSDIRVYLTMSVPLLYFYLRPIELTHNVIRFFSKMITILVGYCYFVWGFYLGTGVNLCSSSAGGGLRVWGSAYALVIAAWTICRMYMEIVVNRRNGLSAKSLLLLVSIVILQHNSVWAALAVGVIALAALHCITNENNRFGPIRQKKLLAQLFIIALAVAVVLIMFRNTAFVSTLTSTSDKYNQMGTGTGTIGGRQLIWAAYLASLSQVQWLIGKPMGTGWVVSYGIVQDMLAPPHNAYVQGIMRIGLLGTVCLFAMLVFVLVKAIRKKMILPAAILIATFTYLYAYMFSLEMSCIWGTIICVVLNSKENVCHEEAAEGGRRGKV